MEIGAVLEALDILYTAGAQIIDDEYLMPVFEQPLSKVRTDKACPSRH
jgi:hypothetical protein